MEKDKLSQRPKPKAQQQSTHSHVPGWERLHAQRACELRGEGWRADGFRWWQDSCDVSLELEVDPLPLLCFSNVLSSTHNAHRSELRAKL